MPVQVPSRFERDPSFRAKEIESHLKKEGIALLPPMEAKRCIEIVRDAHIQVTTTILDPWYNKGFGGVRDDYDQFIVELLALAATVSRHVFLWGFPEIVARFVEKIPAPLSLVAWLTWYYKNSPSVIRGWRSSQNACLHLAHPGAKLYPEHFLNAAQKDLQARGKLRYMPGPTSVIEESLLVGFVGRHEQTGHPSQKPVAVFEKLILMTTQQGDLVLDPMCGSGTAGDAAKRLERLAILSDVSADYTQIVAERLGVVGIGGSKRLMAKTARPHQNRMEPSVPGGLFG
jgi:site-specific DNA-methyltransferase (adenine-specific)